MKTKSTNNFYSVHTYRDFDNDRLVLNIKNEPNKKIISGNSAIFFKKLLSKLQIEISHSQQTNLKGISEAVDYIKGRLSSRRIYRIFSYIPFTKAYAIRKLIRQCGDALGKVAASIEANRKDILRAARKNKDDPYQFFSYNKTIESAINEAMLQVNPNIPTGCIFLYLNYNIGNSDSELVTVKDIAITCGTTVDENSENKKNFPFIVVHNKANKLIKLADENDQKLYNASHEALANISWEKGPSNPYFPSSYFSGLVRDFFKAALNN